MAKAIIVSIFILFLSVAGLESYMRACYGVLPFEPVPYHFEYKYVDIYKPLFAKDLKKGIYVSYREEGHAETFSVFKSPDTVRIFIIGGSVAGGWGSDDFTTTLKEIVPDKNFEIINCGMGGYDSYRVSLIAKEIVSYEPDLVIVLSGNNEFYEKAKINLWGYYANKSLRGLWIYRKLQNYLLRWLDDRDLLYKRSAKQKLVDYERNIRRIVKMVKAKNVPIILGTLPVNFRDCPPDDARFLDKQFLLGKFLLESGDYLEAIDVFKDVINQNSDNSLGYYFLGRAYDKGGDYLKAKENYLTAVSLSVTWNRAKPGSNAIIRQICEEKAVVLADLELEFMNISLHGLLGREQFYDSCHFWDEYYSVVTRVIVNEIFKDEALSYILGSSRYKLDYPLFSFDFTPLKKRRINEDDIESAIKVAMWESGIGSDNTLNERAVLYLKTVYLIDTDSLWGIKDSKEKIKALFFTENSYKGYFDQFDTNFDAYWPQIFYHIGETYRRLKLYKESLIYFNEAIVLDEDNYLPYLGKALVYRALGDTPKARENINKAGEKAKGLEECSLEVKYYKEILEL